MDAIQKYGDGFPRFLRNIIELISSNELLQVKIYCKVSSTSSIVVQFLLESNWVTNHYCGWWLRHAHHPYIPKMRGVPVNISLEMHNFVSTCVLFYNINFVSKFIGVRNFSVCVCYCIL